ncbi:MAG TPA: folylpolyglutamate synthase/dihydrofolate synthase family protein [Methylomirabilota bacterium]|nr:folylpolyglutamate synthase/dihydrofolate synthase family protein [Methylomirabilota bacterium]
MAYSSGVPPSEGMTYQTAVDTLAALQPQTIRPGLDRIKAMLAELAHPEATFKIIQVAGTNGKGSTGAMVAAILQSAGCRVGLYTSPHLCSVRERIRVNRVPISREEFAEGIHKLLPLAQTIAPTYFEVLTALGLHYFARREVEWAVLEVGMGGRWDATTVGSPLASVITPIDFDHQAYLGWRLEEIAAEKAAIIRSGVAVSAAQAPAVEEVIKKRSELLGVQLLIEGRELSIAVRHQDPSGHRLDLKGPDWELPDLALPLLGLFQPTNCLLAVGAVRALRSSVTVSDKAIREGVRTVRWPGRFQLLQEEPYLVVDSAHNPAGARALAHSLRTHFPRQAITLILGIYKDKDKAQILETLTPLADRIILTASSHPRAASPDELRGLVPSTHAEILVISNILDALTLALTPPTTPVICVAGSLSLVAEALEWFHAQGPDIPCEV